MQCAQCDNGEMRLVRFENRQEVYACRQCHAESLLLDCHYCERRTVRQLADAQGVQRWACHRCQVTQYKCPSCNSGWVIAQAALNAGKSGFSCGHCKTHWLKKESIVAS